MTDDVQGGSDSRRLYSAFTAAFQNEDNDAIRALLVPAAVMIGPAGNVLSGRDAIVAFLQRAQRIQNVRFETSDSKRLSDDLMRDVGDLILTVRGQGRDTREVPAKFLTLWTRLDGVWKIESCVWSRRANGQRGRNQATGGRGRQGGGGQGGGGFGGGRAGSGQGGGGQGGAGFGGGRAGGRQGGGGQGGGDFGGGRAGGGRMGARRLSPEEGGSFNRRNLHRDDPAPLIPRVD